MHTKTPSPSRTRLSGSGQCSTRNRLSRRGLHAPSGHVLGVGIWLGLSCFVALSSQLSCGPGGGGGTGGSAGAAGTGGAAGAAGTAGAAGNAGSGGVALDGGEDAGGVGGGDASADGSAGTGGTPGDGSTGDGASDGPLDGPVSQFCGDGVRDPVTEECDDGTGSSPPDSCNAQCVVQDVLVSPGPGSEGGVPPKVTRRLGEGRHPVGADGSGFAVAFVETHAGPKVGVRIFDEDGVPGAIAAVAQDGSTTEKAHPVVAALPGDGFAVVWSDNGADGDGRGIALRTVSAAGALGAKQRVNGTTSFNQRDVDLIWTGSELVAAWVDESKIATTGLDIKLRTLSASGTPQGSEQVLAGTKAHESQVALAAFNGGWAAAWRARTGTTETIAARAGSASFSVSVASPGPSLDKPALVAIDGSRLLLVFTEGGSAFGTAALRGAVLDTAAPGAATSFAIAPLVAPYSTDTTLGQSEPALARVGNRVFLAWRSEAVLADSKAEELWLKEITWTAGGGITLDLSKLEIPLPRQTAHRADDQRRVALAATPLWPGGALATAWDDYGRVFGSIEGTPDVVAELIPVPIVRGGGLQIDGGS